MCALCLNVISKRDAVILAGEQLLFVQAHEQDNGYGGIVVIGLPWPL